MLPYPMFYLGVKLIRWDELGAVGNLGTVCTSARRFIIIGSGLTFDNKITTRWQFGWTIKQREQNMHQLGSQFPGRSATIRPKEIPEHGDYFCKFTPPNTKLGRDAIFD